MTHHERLRQLLKAEPFAPFRVRLANGSGFTVRERDGLVLAPGGTSLIQNCGSHAPSMHDMAQVVDLLVLPPDLGPVGIDAILNRVRAQTFRPFTLVTANGPDYAVLDRELIARTADGRKLSVATAEGKFALIATRDVVALDEHVGG